MNLANKITLIRIGFIPLFMYCFNPFPKIAILLFLLASATDRLDGYIARKYNQVTNLGKLLDPLADKLLISVALILMVGNHQVTAWAAFVIIGREILITAIRMLASAKGVALQADNWGKIKLVLQVAAIAAVMIGEHMLPIIQTYYIDDILMLLAVGLTIYSGYNYIRNNYKMLGLYYE
ncbi:CDP-diacylglycerol--glycerol-3-phosphate 3-phosphatidyltransferase [Paenibacillus sp. N1-5-1-14]|uniref:CDP-diacylglycerol--glycerol-3-phosphate 3-phosphatidyltransferase n=1 Tax=Paenibacillus radicibacter TaxID=2972488 RepID=UPI0021593E00|nr:CDP-diacylglycerol--glycerol-3-phosphate 3-phosphatidyltransferase [Paenibacillus radicibacter]MCR8642393.1 CDP-diacylglycerol--glycerol-3-phosphate 3-phosphatidyltransferase [Paenibacillus radicibacter]